MFTICLQFGHTLFTSDLYNVLEDKGKGYSKRVLKVIYMWYVINQDGERIAVETKDEAIRLCATDNWYTSYVYSNCGGMF